MEKKKNSKKSSRAQAHVLEQDEIPSSVKGETSK